MQSRVKLKSFDIKCCCFILLMLFSFSNATSVQETVVESQDCWGGLTLRTPTLVSKSFLFLRSQD